MIQLQRKFNIKILRLRGFQEYVRKNRFMTTQKLAIFTSYLLFSWPFPIETISTRAVDKLMDY